MENTYSAPTYNVSPIADTSIPDGRQQYQGSVSWPDRTGHVSTGAELPEQLLTFPVHVYMNPNTLDADMQAYADDYLAGYWQSVGDGS